jgi:hypothetical protein
MNKLELDYNTNQNAVFSTVLHEKEDKIATRDPDDTIQDLR